jgi:hypothetical protein
MSAPRPDSRCNARHRAVDNSALLAADGKGRSPDRLALQGRSALVRMIATNARPDQC